jgi:hypothetical protein
MLVFPVHPYLLVDPGFCCSVQLDFLGHPSAVPVIHSSSLSFLFGKHGKELGDVRWKK